MLKQRYLMFKQYRNEAQWYQEHWCLGPQKQWRLQNPWERWNTQGVQLHHRWQLSQGQSSGWSKQRLDIHWTNLYNREGKSKTQKSRHLQSNGWIFSTFWFIPNLKVSLPISFGMMQKRLKIPLCYPHTKHLTQFLVLKVKVGWPKIPNQPHPIPHVFLDGSNVYFSTTLLKAEKKINTK